MKTERLIYIANYIYGYRRYIYREDDKMIYDTFAKMAFDIDRFNDLVLCIVYNLCIMIEPLVTAKDVCQEMVGMPNETY